MHGFRALRAVRAGFFTLLSLRLGSALCGAGTVTYNYVGNKFTGFTTAPSPWTTSNSVAGSFTTSSPLGANLALLNVTGTVSSFSFTDGSVNTITSSANSGSFFLFSTDSLGNITSWDVRAFLGSPPNNVAVFTCNGSTVFNGCTNFPIDESYQHNGAATGYNQSNPGRWTATLNSFQGGPSSAPVFLVSGPPVAAVTGTIGGSASVDYYSFLWSGGAFSATASLTGASAGASYLFSAGVAGTCSSAGTAKLNAGDSFASTIAIANLAPGQYCIGIDANSLIDPAFTLTFNTPVSGLQTPEPSGLVMLSVGLGMLGVRRFRKCRRKDS